MADVLVVSYADNGTCCQLARCLSQQQVWPTAKITELRPRRGASGHWLCLLESLLHRHPDLRYDGPPPDTFDVVVLIAPLWAYRLAGPMRRFVADRAQQLPSLAVIAVSASMSVMGDQGDAQAAAEVARLLGRAPVLSAAFSARSVADGSCVADLQAFGDTLEAGTDPQVATRPAVFSPQGA